MEASVKVVGLKPFAKEISRIYRATGNLGPAYKGAAILYRKWIGKNFDAEGRLHDNSGLYWKKLKRERGRNVRTARTTGKRDRIFKKSKILRDTGRLARDWELSSSNTGARLRSAVYYSSIHNEGASNAGRSRNVEIPKRQIFPEDPQGQKIIAPAFNQHLFKGKNRI